jgi:hypothetical protein
VGYNAATPVIQNITIIKAAQTITFAAQTKTYGSPDFVPATVSSGLPITYTSSNVKIASIVKGKVHIVAPGVVIVTAGQAGTAFYSAAKPVSQSITVNKVAQTITFATIKPVYGNADFAPATASSKIAVIYAS